ncbi:MAG: FG-GAP repeat domain-containing protein, partial [Myxococcota bacterium]
DTDEDTDTAPVDTAETGTPPSCPDQTFPADTVAPVDACEAGAAVGSFTPEVEWTWSRFDVAPSSLNVMMTPIVVSLTDDDGDGDADADDVPDVVFVTYTGEDWSDSGVLRAVSGDGTAAIFDVEGERVDGCSGVAGGDLDGDGRVEIVAVTWDKKVKAFAADGTLLWTSGQYAAHLGSYASVPAIADLDGDGSPEVIVGSLILNADGSFRGGGDHGIGAHGLYGTTSFAADLDGDGAQEVIVGNAAYDADGNTLFYNGEADGYVAAGDFDGDGTGEVVVVSAGTVRLQDAAGVVLWETAIPGGTGAAGGPPTVADYDADGAPEIGVAGTSTYTVLDTDGAVLWQVETVDASSGVTGSAVFDFEGDGAAEAVYADELYVWAFAGADGAVKLESTEHTNWTVVEYAPVVDVDGDGEAEIVVPNGLHPVHASFTRYGITVLGDADHSWRAGRRIWNQHAYAITNVDDDGGIPAAPAPNWDTYNNFRSGDLGGGPAEAAADLVVQIDDVCASFCAEGRWLVWARVGNRGAVDIRGPVSLALWAETGAGDVLLAETTVGYVPAGELLASVAFDVSGVDPATLTALGVRVDGGNADAGAWEECVEDDDEDRWTDVACP